MHNADIDLVKFNKTADSGIASRDIQRLSCINMLANFKHSLNKQIVGFTGLSKCKPAFKFKFIFKEILKVALHSLNSVEWKHLTKLN